MSEKKIVLEVNKLGIDFGGLTAVNNFNMKIYENEICGLIGPNGAGKTTVFNLLTKVYEQSRGEIILNGNKVGKISTHEINKMGIARTFQNIRLFDQMSVIDNVIVAMNNQINYSLFDSFFRTKKFHDNELKYYDKALELLKIFNLDEYKDNKASSLPYGGQRRLEIARALASNPSILLLDEPAAGMNETETLDLLNTIKKVRDTFNIAILLIEHDMKFVMSICERITVLNYGQILAVGSPDEIKNNPKVIEAYLGGA